MRGNREKSRESVVKGVNFAILTVCLVLAPTAGLAAERVPEDPSPSAAVIAQAERVADWQLAHLDNFDYLATFQRQAADPVDWLQAAFWIGLTELSEHTSAARYVQAIYAVGGTAEWGFGLRLRHADADAIGGVWIWAANRVEGEARERRLAPTLARFDSILATPSNVPLIFEEGPGERPCQVRWCWSDAIFMSPPVWANLSATTGEPAYWRHADHELRATIDALYDADEGLFYRDSRFIGRVGPAGRKVFWSRGNGWSYAGLARTIDALDPADPSRSFYIDMFRQMSDRLAALQGEEGYWPVSLLDPGGPPETSGTAFFVYGMAWGVNTGLLDADRFGPRVRLGWAALDRAVQPDGRLGWVQQVGYAPDRVEATDTQLFGGGAFLMAASQVSQKSNW